MKIILIASVHNLGKIGDVVEVRDGFAKNFLIPNKKAICFTVNNSKIFEDKRHEFEKENNDTLAKASSLKDFISGKDIIVIENASDDGRLYGSVNSSVIADKINQITKQKSVSRIDIFLQKPIKDIGVYKVKVAPHSEVSFEVRVIVTRSESEVAALLKAEQKAKNPKAADDVEEASSASEEDHSEKPVKAKKPARKKAAEAE